MSRYPFGCVAAALTFTVAVGAQAPTTQDPQTSPTTRTPTAQDQRGDQSQMSTVEGCLMREADVPGRQPNMAERAGIAEDYILTDIKVIKGTAPGARTGRSGSSTAAGTSGSRSMMLEVEGIDDERLKQHVGQRVQIDGMFENVDQARDRAEAGTPTDDLAEIRGNTIRRVSGDCQQK